MDLRSSKAKLFLIELIIIILFFAFAAGVCMNMFTAAKRISINSTEMTRASMAAQSAAEAIKSGGEDGLRALDAQMKDGNYEVHYDENWDIVPTDGVYQLDIDLSRENGMLSADVQVAKDDTVLYTITAKRFDGK